jgi:shikimate kinase
VGLPNLILIGYRGTGKTTVGRLLAARLGRPFADADDLVEATAGASIADIFAAEGEPGFRDREAAALASLCARADGVIATGGGAVLRESTRKMLRHSGFVVWLTATPETVAARLAADATTRSRRPNLTAAGGSDEIRHLLAARAPLYRETADVAVETDTLSPEQIADTILAAWTV